MTVDISPFADLYPFVGKRLDLPSESGAPLRMHYLDEGQGKPLVFVHGNPTWSFYWRNLLGPLSSEYRCVAPDHIGMGLSDKPDDSAYRYTLERRVDDLEALLEHLDVQEQVTLVLHDWGGMIGLAWATRHPERVARLVLLNTAGFTLPQGRGLPWQLWLIKNLPFSVPVRGFNAFCRGGVMMCSTKPGRMTEPVKQAYLAPYDSWANRIAIHRFVQDIPLRESDPAWDTVQGVTANLPRWNDIPVQIFWGEQDFVFDLHFLAEWKRLLPGAELHSYPDCGHYVVEDAHERILPAMRDFFARSPLRDAE